MSRYILLYVDGKVIPEHRFIWEQNYGPIPKGYEIHHINGDGKDNRIENLMCLTHSEHLRLHEQLLREGRDVVNPNDPDVIHDREKRKQHYRNNREASLARHREYYKKHVEERRKFSKEYRERFHDVVLERDRDRNKLRKVQKAISNKKWRLLHKEETAENNKKWRLNNREACQLYKCARRAVRNAQLRLKTAEAANLSSSVIDSKFLDVLEELSKFNHCRCDVSEKASAVEALAVFERIDADSRR